MIKLAKDEDDLVVIDFPREMLDTRHDDDLAESILLKDHLEFEYLGVLIYGDAKKVDLLTKEFRLWG